MTLSLLLLAKKHAKRLAGLTETLIFINWDFSDFFISIVTLGITSPGNVGLPWMMWVPLGTVSAIPCTMYWDNGNMGLLSLMSTRWTINCREKKKLFDIWYCTTTHRTQWVNSSPRGQYGCHFAAQTIFSKAFSWMKNFVFWLKFHRSLFLRVLLTITQHWLRSWLGTE